MAKKTNGFTRAFRKLGRAFAAKDERAFEDAMDEMEENFEEEHHDEEPEIEVHNHIPGMDNMGQLPEKDPPGFDRRARDEEEMPPWAKKEKEANDARWKSMSDSIEELRSKSGEDRRHDDGELPEALREHEFGKGEDETATEENLEMEDRHRDRRHDDRRDRRGRDEPSEREEMAERIRERGGDRRGSDKRDEANKEILGELEFEAPPGTGDKARRATDSQYLEEAFQDTLSKAEVLAPGISLPTFDRKAAPVPTFRQIHKLRQTALDLAYNKAETRGAIDAAMGGRTLDSKRISYGVTRTLFNSAATMVGSSNNHRATDRSSFSTQDRGVKTAGIQSIGDLNKHNREKYAASGTRR